jgi:hypothetical protein
MSHTDAEWQESEAGAMGRWRWPERSKAAVVGRGREMVAEGALHSRQDRVHRGIVQLFRITRPKLRRSSGRGGLVGLGARLAPVSRFWFRGISHKGLMEQPTFRDLMRSL